MEVLGTIALIVLLVAVLVVLLYAWGYHCKEGGFWNFWMAWNILDLAGHVCAALLALLASLFNNNNS